MAKQQYNVKLEPSEVDGYWRILGMDREAWMGLPKAQRVQTAWKDMLNKQQAAQEANERAQQFRRGGS